MTTTPTNGAASIRERAEAALARAKAASTGPWTTEAGEYSGENWLIASLGRGNDDRNHFITTHNVHRSEMSDAGAEDDAAFIAAARADAPDFARFIVRVTSPEMRERIARFLIEWQHDDEADFGTGADGLMSLLTEESP